MSSHLRLGVPSPALPGEDRRCPPVGVALPLPPPGRDISSPPLRGLDHGNHRLPDLDDHRLRDPALHLAEGSPGSEV